MSRCFSKGQKVGRWTIMESGSFLKEDFVECLCDCGSSRAVRAANLEKQLSKSCGCARRDSCRLKCLTHGRSRTPIYRVWKGMKKRCENPKSIGFQNYGGRGISVCERWSLFENFDEDMRDTYKHGLFIERLDNEGNYSPDNCRWATRKVQNRNKRDTISIHYKGITLPLVTWCENLGINYYTARQRYKTCRSTTEILSSRFLKRRN